MMRHTMRRLHKGFTLIELMIVVVVIAILSAIAVPSYNYYVTRAKRSAARSAIQNTAQQEERYFTQNNGYQAVAFGGTPASGWVNYVGDSYGARTYDLSVAVTAATTTTAASFVISAQPAGTTVSGLTATAPGGFNDTVCGALTLTSTGIQSQTVGSSDQCWSR